MNEGSCWTVWGVTVVMALLVVITLLNSCEREKQIIKAITQTHEQVQP